MLRSTAHVLVVVMLVASGRLLACGLECLDELAAPAQASCHQESALATAVHGDTVHACLPESVEPRVTVAKPTSAQMLIAVPVVTPVVTTVGSANAPQRHVVTLRPRFDSAHLPGLSVLRI